MSELKERKENLEKKSNPKLDKKIRESFNQKSDRADKAKQKIEISNNQDENGLEDFNNIKNIKDISVQKSAFDNLLKTSPKLTQDVVIFYSELLKNQKSGDSQYDYIRDIRDGFIDGKNCNPDIIFPYLMTINSLSLGTSKEIGSLRNNLIDQEYSFSEFIEKFPQFTKQCVKYRTSVRSSIYKNYEVIEKQIGTNTSNILDRISSNIDRFNSGKDSFGNKILIKK